MHSNSPDFDTYELYLARQRDHFRRIERHLHHTFEPSEQLLHSLEDFYEASQTPRLKIIGTKKVVMPGEQYYGGSEQRELLAATEAFRSKTQPIALSGEMKVRIDRLGRGQFAMKVARQALFNDLLNSLDALPGVQPGPRQAHYLIATGALGAVLRSPEEFTERIDAFGEMARSEIRSRLLFVRPLDIAGYDVIVPPGQGPSEPNAQTLPQAS